MKIIAVLAMTDTLLIGSKNGLPWHLPEDMRHFKELTKGWVVVMGKTTYFSLPESFRPLPGRRNIVLTRTPIEGITCFDDIDTLVRTLSAEGVENIYIIGGAQIYDTFFARWLVDRVELTLVEGTYEWDIHVQEFRSGFSEIKRTKGEQVSFVTLEKV